MSYTSQTAEENKITIPKKHPKSLTNQLKDFKAQGGFYEPSQEDMAWSTMELIGAEQWLENE